MRPTSAPGWSAVLAWYSLIHLAASELPDALAALTRPLVPGGWLVVALHAGAEVRHHDDWFDVAGRPRLRAPRPAEVVALVEAAGLTDVEWYHRGPITARGETTERLYVVGRKPLNRRRRATVAHAGAVLVDVRPRPRHSRCSRWPARSGRPATTSSGPPPRRRRPWSTRPASRPSRAGAHRRRGGGAPGRGPRPRPSALAGPARAAFVFPRMFGEALTPPMVADLLRPRPRLATRPARPRARGAGRAAGRRGPRRPERHPLVRHGDPGRDPRRDPATGWPGCGARTASTCRRTPGASGPATSTSARRPCRPCRSTTSPRSSRCGRSRTRGSRRRPRSRSSTSPWAPSSSDRTCSGRSWPASPRCRSGSWWRSDRRPDPAVAGGAARARPGRGVGRPGGGALGRCTAVVSHGGLRHLPGRPGARAAAALPAAGAPTSSATPRAGSRPGPPSRWRRPR